jgi:DNA polymerase III sliding clamp (beta) subunit (PCNA family)
MNFTIGQATLAEALNNLVRNTNEKFPAFQNIQIEVINENQIRLSAENGINKLEYTIEARNASGEPIMVNAKRFTDIINKLKDIITLHDNVIMCEKTKIKIDYTAEKLITPIETTEEHSEINLSKFKNVVKNRLYAVETKMQNAVISNMFVNGGEIAATNGNVLSVGTLETPVYKSFLLSQSLAKEIITDFKDDETVNITVDDGKKVIIWNDKLKIESKLQTGQFPTYNQLIPQPAETIKINKNELINKLEIMSIVVEFTKPQIKLVFCNNELTLEHKDGKTVMSIENYSRDEAFEIYFNIFYLISALKSSNGDFIEVQLGANALSAIVIKTVDDRHVIMPVQVRA